MLSKPPNNGARALMRILFPTLNLFPPVVEDYPPPSARGRARSKTLRAVRWSTARAPASGSAAALRRFPPEHRPRITQPDRCHGSGWNGQLGRSRRQPAAASRARRRFSIQGALRAPDGRAGSPAEQAGGLFHPDLNCLHSAYKNAAPAFRGGAASVRGLLHPPKVTSYTADQAFEGTLSQKQNR
jgi:hypothetical protein